jgi:hypothetical protein
MASFAWKIATTSAILGSTLCMMLSCRLECVNLKKMSCVHRAFSMANISWLDSTFSLIDMLNFISCRFQVVTNKDTQESLLCIAYVFEVSTSEHGAQHNTYRLVKDWNGAAIYLWIKRLLECSIRCCGGSATKTVCYKYKRSLWKNGILVQDSGLGNSRCQW